MSYPAKKDITLGNFKKIGEVWHKRCNGPFHEEPTYLPATEKYFHARKRRPGLVSRCRVCTNSEKVKIPQEEHALIDAALVRHFYAEAANRIGLGVLAERTGLSGAGLSNVIVGKTRHVRKSNLKKVMIELASIRRNNEYSLSAHSLKKVRYRTKGPKDFCVSCGTEQNNYVLSCPTCVTRMKKRESRGISITD